MMNLIVHKYFPVKILIFDFSEKISKLFRKFVQKFSPKLMQKDKLVPKIKLMFKKDLMSLAQLKLTAVKNVWWVRIFSDIFTNGNNFEFLIKDTNVFCSPRGNYKFNTECCGNSNSHPRNNRSPARHFKVISCASQGKPRDIFQQDTSENNEISIFRF